MSRIEKPNVLLVDDNEATSALMAALLQREFSIQTATDGHEAIEQLKTREFGAILLDLRMPRLDGFGVLDYLREHSPETVKRVIVVSAALHEREVERLRGYEVCATVRKPFEIDVLLDLVKSCTGFSGGSLRHVLRTGTPVIFLLAEMLRQLQR